MDFFFSSPRHVASFRYNAPTSLCPFSFNLPPPPQPPSPTHLVFSLGNCFALFVPCAPTSPSSLASSHFSLVLHTIFLLTYIFVHRRYSLSLSLLPRGRFHLIAVLLDRFLLTAAPFHPFFFLFMLAPPTTSAPLLLPVSSLERATASRDVVIPSCRRNVPFWHCRRKSGKIKWKIQLFGDENYSQPNSRNSLSAAPFAFSNKSPRIALP